MAYLSYCPPREQAIFAYDWSRQDLFMEYVSFSSGLSVKKFHLSWINWGQENERNCLQRN